MRSTAMNAVTKKSEAALRAFALTMPGAYEEFPWGDRAIKVNKKVFVFMGAGKEGLGISVKLGQSHAGALSRPFASPTRYGLGKSGWVSARFLAGQRAPVEELCRWVEESYRLIAPKRMVKEMDAGGTVAAREGARKSARKRG